MRRVNLSHISEEECQGIQINGLRHCRNINCKWQGLSACLGKNIIRTGYNSKGYRICEKGMLS
ncbi:MAG: hypothetical protein GXO89_03910 [Chlorobi bacterium]|nr:hypothetical protein [Chlorobiota bacterium]